MFADASPSKGKVMANRLLFGRLYEYCSVAELATMAYLAKDFKNTVDLAFKDKLLLEGVDVSSFTGDYMRVYKELHLKSVIILPLSSINCKDRIDVFSAAKITKKTMFVDRIVKDFSLGIKFAGYHFDSNDLVLLTKEEYLTQNRHTLSKKTHHKVVKGVVQFNLESRHATFLDEESKLRAIYYVKSSNIHEMPEILLDTDVADFKANYNYMAYCKKDGDCYLYINYSSINQGTAIKYRVVKPQGSFQMFLSGINLYLKDLNSAKFYSVNFATLDPVAIEGNTSLKQVSMTEVVFVIDKPVVNLFTGLRNEIMLCEVPYKASPKWSNEEVRDWFRSIGVASIDGTLKYEKFTGADLSLIDKQMMVDRFGISNTDVHNKITSEILLEQSKTNHEPELWGIGYNMDGQLCVNNSHKMISMWTKLKLPDLANTDCVKDIIFGWSNTLVVTKEERLFLSYKKPKPRGEAEAEVDEKQPKVLKLNSKKSNQRKHSESNYGPIGQGVEDAPFFDAKRKKNSKKFDDAMISEDDLSSSEEAQDSKGAKRNKKKTSNTQRYGRGIKKEKRKYSFQPNELRRDDDEGVARWIEITNLFQINKYSRANA